MLSKKCLKKLKCWWKLNKTQYNPALKKTKCKKPIKPNQTQFNPIKPNETPKKQHCQVFFRNPGYANSVWNGLNVSVMIQSACNELFHPGRAWGDEALSNLAPELQFLSQCHETLQNSQEGGYHETESECHFSWPKGSRKWLVCENWPLTI